MSIADQISRLNNAKASIKESIKNKGVDVSDDALLDEYPALIDSIEAGGEGGDPYYEDFYNLRTNNGTDMVGLFAYCTVPELDLRKLDTGNVTNMDSMFYYCYSSFINIDGWDTSNVTDMDSMFWRFTGSVDVSKLDTSKVTNINSMFRYANTDNIILTGLSFPSTTSLGYMFDSASGTSIDLSSWDISNITNMNYMFNNADYKRIDLTGWKTTNVTNMSSMFSKYNNPLVELIIPDWDMSNCSANIFYNGSYISKLNLIDLSRSNDTTITKITSFLPTRTTTTFGTVMVPSNTSQEVYDDLIAKYWRPIGADLSPAPASVEIVAELDQLKPGKPKTNRLYVKNTSDVWYADTRKVEIVNVSEYDTAILEGNTLTTISGASGDINLEARVIDTQEVVGTKRITIFNGDSYPGVIKFRSNKDLKSSSSTAISVTLVDESTTLRIAGNNASLVYDKYFDMYTYDAGSAIGKVVFNENNYCPLTEIVKLNTSNLYSTEYMFSNQLNLTTLDLSDWDTSNLKSIAGMFYKCKNLTTINFSGWDISNIFSMSSLFSGCENLITLDLSDWDISNVATTGDMFDYCYKLTHFKAPQNISYTFDLEFCRSLTHESLMSVINNLIELPDEYNNGLYLNMAVIDTLSAEEIAIATNKGWTVRFYNI